MNPITSEKTQLGFVGIGYMGRPIAHRLLKSGFKLTAYDRNRSKAQELIQFGGTVAGSIAELASSCDVVLSCLPSDEAVLHVYRGPDGAFAHAGQVAEILCDEPDSGGMLAAAAGYQVGGPRACRVGEQLGALFEDHHVEAVAAT